jgi:gliding motility-associated-like protein
MPNSFKTLALLAALCSCVLVRAQIPTQCLEIESILVDACTDAVACPGATEGENEMVLFITGPDPIALADLDINWPNNSFQGLVQNGTTANLTAALNATVQSCGLLIEPPGGIIPAGRRVLLITSTDMCVEANSFTSLSDTLYLIFQNAGNTSGHFANTNNGGNVSQVPNGGVSTRTLIITYTQTGCADTATYDRQELVNVFGSYAGTSAENDGATVRFTWPGDAVATYVNFGCQAPFTPLIPNIVTPGGALACGGSVGLQATVQGAYSSIQWSGGTGVFSAPNDTSTTYIAGPNDAGTITLYFCASNTCVQPQCDSVTFTIDVPQAVITPSGPLTLCPGDQLTLTASGGDAYVWSSGEAVPVIVVDQAGTYSVVVSNACGDHTVSVTVAAGSLPTASISGDTLICAGATTLLTASGGATYAWSSGQVSPSITVGVGTYTVTSTNNCGSTQASITVHASALDVSAVATPTSGPAPLQVSVLAQGVPGDITSWAWSWGDGGTTGSSASEQHVFTAPGTYTVTVTGTASTGCIDSYTLTIIVSNDVPVSSLVVPNVFSPNGDSQNDVFKLINTGIATLRMDIYNRWGQRVSGLNRPDAAWTGRDDSGERLSEGTYFYSLQATGADGKLYDLHGAVTLLR